MSNFTFFPGLLYCINWANINHAFVCEHLDKEDLYRSSQDSLFTILSVTERQNVYLGQKFHDLYQQMQERILPEQELDELNDSNSFLSMAINSAVKDLEQSEVIFAILKICSSFLREIDVFSF